MPRPASPVWEHFRKEMPNKRATCSYCGANMCGLIVRMRTHLARRCDSCPESVKAEMTADLSRKLHHDSAAQPAKKARTKKDPLRPEAQDQAPSAPEQAPTPTAEHQVQTTSPRAQSPVAVLDSKSDLDGYVARAIFGVGLPVATVEHTAFVKMLKVMNPNYDPPSAFVLATSVLDLEYSEVQIKLRAEVLDSTAVSLGVESWAQQKRALVTCVLNSPSPAIFAFDSTGDMTHTPEMLVDKVENIMTQIGTERVSVIVMETTDCMKQASLTLEGKYPTITFLPSCAHTMTAMMTDMLDLSTIADTLDTCTQLAHFFVQDPVARAAIARVAEQSIEAAAPMGDPTDTTPSGLLDCLFTIERNRHSLDILLAENGTLSALNTRVKDRIISLTFWEEVSTLTGLFEPFLEILKMFESDSPLLSTFYHRFTLLWGHLDKYGGLASKFQHIVSRYWQTIQHPAMYTAYLLDPRFPPSSLSGEATSEALSYIKRTSNPEVYGSIVDELTRFTARTGLFSDDAIWDSGQKCSPLDWWKGFIGSSCPNLQPVALRTLGFPASSGLSQSKREVFEKIQVMNAKYMSDEQANKAAVVYLNSNLSSNVEDAIANETKV
ncbi:zinc finger bed domain-containing protein 1-like [Phytophthora cinnamomi]|uniref:zinc finger bed domain-containing protein 1-like n=1 Tax=Phytophthora cinnamomi TaxID=4785 RepID=UPI00355AB4FC|nr:zinc finger bed domain-containing protein 1-like [Phytophthora cinnamomi]